MLLQVLAVPVVLTKLLLQERLKSIRSDIRLEAGRGDPVKPLLLGLLTINAYLVLSEFPRVDQSREMLLSSVEKLGAGREVGRSLEVFADLEQLCHSQGVEAAVEQESLDVGVENGFALICNRIATQYFEEVLRFDRDRRVNYGSFEFAEEEARGVSSDPESVDYFGELLVVEVVAPTMQLDFKWFPNGVTSKVILLEQEHLS